MVNSYDDMMGDATDPRDHSAHNVPDATQHYAGDVLPIAGEKSMGGGMTSSALDYARGIKTDPKVVPMPSKQMNGAANRVLQMLGK